MDILRRMKDVQFYLDQVHTDALNPVQGGFLNQAKNVLMKLIADGERHERDKLFPPNKWDDEKRGDPLG